LAGFASGHKHPRHKEDRAELDDYLFVQGTMKDVPTSSTWPNSGYSLVEWGSEPIGALPIRPISDADVAFSAQLNADENWTDTLWDIKRLMRCEPKGCLIAELCGRPVGQILSISYGKLGWIGVLIVLREHRGKGIGSALVRRAIAYLKESGVETIELEAAPGAVSLYKRFGFELESKTWKFTRLNEHIRMESTTPVETMRNRDLDEVGDFDKRFFLGDRSKVLGGILVDNPDLCHVAKHRGKLMGYVMCRPTRVGFRIGPLVCDPSAPKIAEALFVTAMNSVPLGARISLSAPETNIECLNLLSKYGFERLALNVTMFAGDRLNVKRLVAIFALGGLEKG